MSTNMELNSKTRSQHKMPTILLGSSLMQLPGGMAGAAFSAGRYGMAAANTARSIGTGVLAGADQ